MTVANVIGLAASYIYAFGLLLLAEVIRRWRSYPQDFTRKLVHIGAGMWVIAVLALFDSWYIGIIPFATFILFNFLLYRFRLLRSIDADTSSPGTIYFAAAITLLFLIFWPRGWPVIAVAGTMAMTWGDAFAAIIGRLWGRHRYTILGQHKSLEGSLAMFAFSLVAILLTLVLMMPGLALSSAVIASLVAALVATAIEAISPAGLDNLSVPVVTAFVVWAMIGSSL